MPATKKLAGMARSYTGEIIVVFNGKWNYPFVVSLSNHEGSFKLPFDISV